MSITTTAAVLIPFAPMGKVKIEIDRANGRSLTDQLVDGLREAVRLGRWKEGERLPTREELMAMCGVSRNVVQAAVRRRPLNELRHIACKESFRGHALPSNQIRLGKGMSSLELLHPRYAVGISRLYLQCGNAISLLQNEVNLFVAGIPIAQRAVTDFATGSLTCRIAF